MDSDSEGDRGETAGEQTRPRPREVSGSTIERAHSGGTRAAGGKPGAIGLPRLVGRLDLAPSAAEPRVAERNRRRMLETILSYPPVKGASGLSPSLIAAGDTHAPRT